MPLPPDAGTAEVLRSVSFLAAARPESIDLLERRSTRRRLRRGEFLFHEGEPFSRLFVILRGAVSAMATSPHGEKVILHVARPGETPGHLDLLGRALYSASAVALGDVEVLVLSGGDLLTVIESDTAVLRALALDVAEIARALSRTVTDLAFLDLPRRLAALLLDLSGDVGRPSVVLTQGDLAARLSAARQSVNQALGMLARDQLITVGEAGAVTAVDLPRLRQFVASPLR